MRQEWLTGEATLTDPVLGQKRSATYSCAHCNTIQHVPPRADPEKLGGWCMVCDKAICPECVKTGKCDPFEEKLKRCETRSDSLRSYGLIR